MALEALTLRSDRRIVILALALLLVPHLWFVRTDFALYADDWPRLRQRLLVRFLLGAVVHRANREPRVVNRKSRIVKPESLCQAPHFAAGDSRFAIHALRVTCSGTACPPQAPPRA